MKREDIGVLINSRKDYFNNVSQLKRTNITIMFIVLGMLLASHYVFNVVREWGYYDTSYYFWWILFVTWILINGFLLISQYSKIHIRFYKQFLYMHAVMFLHVSFVMLFLFLSFIENLNESEIMGLMMVFSFSVIITIIGFSIKFRNMYRRGEFRVGSEIHKKYNKSEDNARKLKKIIPRTITIFAGAYVFANVLDAMGLIESVGLLIMVATALATGILIAYNTPKLILAAYAICEFEDLEVHK